MEAQTVGVLNLTARQQSMPLVQPLPFSRSLGRYAQKNDKAVKIYLSLRSPWRFSVQPPSSLPLNIETLYPSHTK